MVLTADPTEGVGGGEVGCPTVGVRVGQDSGGSVKLRGGDRAGRLE